MCLFEAHAHYQLPELQRNWEAIEQTLSEISVTRAVVNGTNEGDWPAVRRLVAAHPWMMASYGIHPWHIAARSPDWLELLGSFLENDQAAGVGEVGLDKWVIGHDILDQRRVLEKQLDLAASMNRPISLHCLKAWGELLEVLKRARRPERGFLIHAFGGSRDLAEELLEMGAFFSFNAHFLNPGKEAVREVFAHLPSERLLVETDAPSMRQPRLPDAYQLKDAIEVNHPANLLPTYKALAALRKSRFDALTVSVQTAFAQLFEFS